MTARPAWMPDFVPDDWRLVFDATDDDNVTVQWIDDDVLRVYRAEGAVLEAIRKQYPDFVRRCVEAFTA